MPGAIIASRLAHRGAPPCAPQAQKQLESGRAGKLANFFRHRLIASKPLFILHALRANSLPVAWLGSTAKGRASAAALLLTRAGGCASAPARR